MFLEFHWDGFSILLVLQNRINWIGYRVLPIDDYNFGNDSNLNSKENTINSSVTRDSAKSKTDKVSKITNWVKLENKQHLSKILFNSFPMNAHTLLYP